MNWYKKAIQLRDIGDRNELNKRIRDLKSMISKLERVSEYVFQNAGDAKRILREMAESKEVSSFPQVKDLIKKADEKALDNYKECSEVCKDASDILYDKVKDMEKQRKDFVQNYLPEQLRQRTNKEKEDGKHSKDDK